METQISDRPPAAGSGPGVLGGRYRTQVGLTTIVLSAPVVSALIVEWMVARALDPATVGGVQAYLIPAQALAAMSLLGLPTTFSWITSAQIGSGGHPPVRALSLMAVSLAVAVFLLWWLGIGRVPSGVGEDRLLAWLCGLVAAMGAAAAVLDPMLIALGRIRSCSIIGMIALVASVLVGAVFVIHSVQGALIALPAALAAGAAVRAVGGLLVVNLGNMDSRYSPQFPAGAWGFAAMAAIISLLDAASTWADRLIVSAMNGNSATLALYRYGAREVPLLGGIIGAISHVLLARMTAARTSAVSKPGRDGQKAHADERNRWRLTVALLWVVLIPAGSWLFVHSPALFAWVYGREWAGAADYFRVYLLLLLVRAMPLMVLMQAEGLRGVIVVGSALDLAVAAGGGALLVLIWGCSPMAAAGAYVVGTFLQTGVYLLALWRRCQIVPPWRVFGLSMIVGFGSGIMGLLFMRTLVELFAAVIHAIVVALLVWLLINWVRREEGMTLSENSSDE